jgi:putative transposase
VGRLARLVEDRFLVVYAWALMPNHFHLLVRMGRTPLSRAMRSLLTDYAGAFNRRHRRSGHVFQNRYKSIVCDEETYFLEWVRYLHLNPVRGGIIKTLSGLDVFPYSGHSALLGKGRRAWQAKEPVWDRFSAEASAARRAYRKFVEEGATQGRRPELMGGGLVRSAGGWRAVEKLRKGREGYASDERILGGSDFVETLLKNSEKDEAEREETKGQNVTLTNIAEKACRTVRVEIVALAGGGRLPAVCRAREGAAYLWVEHLGKSGRILAREWNLRPESVSKAAKRGRGEKRKWLALVH